MVMTPSTMVRLGTPIPGFHLPDTEGKIVSPEDAAGAPALLVIFTCNHCPFVKHIQEPLLRLAGEWMERGVAIVAINANDADRYPEDSPGKMAEAVKRYSFPFPYLYDETQEVAKAFGAACTPDFFLYDADRKLVYRGQLDGSRPGNGVPVTGEDLGRALDALLKGETIPDLQLPSMGCNIKWKPGNEPAWFG